MKCLTEISQSTGLVNIAGTDLRGIAQEKEVFDITENFILSFDTQNEFEIARGMSGSTIDMKQAGTRLAQIL